MGNCLVLSQRHAALRLRFRLIELAQNVPKPEEKKITRKLKFGHNVPNAVRNHQRIAVCYPPVTSPYDLRVLFTKILTLGRSTQSKKVILGKLIPLTEAPTLVEVFRQVSPRLDKGVAFGGLVKVLYTLKIKRNYINL